MNDILKQIEVLTEKSNKYDNLKDRYIQQAEKLKEAINILNSLLHDIDPILNMKIKERKYNNNKDLIKEVLNLIRGGTIVSIDFLEKSYNIPNKNAHYILYKCIELDKNVMKRKINNKTELYYNKNI